MILNEFGAGDQYKEKDYNTDRVKEIELKKEKE
jgi:hypothetical protein